ncbi:MAG: phosphatase PAP2 family protein, partial [Opitutales bacterium]
TLLTFGVAGFFVLRRQWAALGLTLVTVIGGAYLVDGLKSLYARERPEITAHLMEEASLSFPSGHSTMAAVVYLTLAVMVAEFQERRRLRVYLMGYAGILVGLIGMSRVVLGVHYPSDVAAGWTLGVLWASGTWLAVRLAKRRSLLRDTAGERA